MSELDLAAAALEHAAGDAQVTVVRERSLHARFARSAPTQLTQIDDVTVHVMAVRDGQPGAATTNRSDDEALRGTAARAIAAAEAAAATGAGDHPGLPGPQSYAAHDGFDAATAELEPDTAAGALRAAFEIAREAGAEAFGIWTAAEVRTAIASSTGVAAEDAVTDTFLKVVCRDADGRSGFATGAGVAAASIQPADVARRAARLLPRGPLAELGPGAHPVVLGPDAVGTLLDFLGGLAFNGLAHAEGRGALTGRLGERVAAASIDLTDSPGHAATLPRAFDAEGIAKTPLALLRDGVAQAVVHDLRSAARVGTGARSTGHATAPGGSPWGPAPTNLVLAGGDAADEAELAGPIERGLYVNRVWYVNPVREKETLLTGVTRDGTFLIEDGEIARPVRDVRFTDSALGVLERAEALTAAARLVTDAEFYGRRFATGTVCPALRASSLRITGGA
ncbi:MAG TPA: metallopeptidase TldD-related protein [Solirubrobacteraceae bacterium]|nr:metallopeptidase TldD-related protein [Solirubrobacteraceae bacterium]